MSDKLNERLHLARRGAAMLRADKRFREVTPLSPVLDGVMVEDGPTFLTITAVGTNGRDLYVTTFTKDTAQELVEHFTEYLKLLEKEEK